ncbi:MAG TPA: sulfatase-like hydrolase/transferase [Planctomycetes bacterium]|nr:sulfatase-like hydrolase/transferase [Planctomycetota bacterium]
MERRDFLKAVGFGTATMALSGCANATQRIRFGANRKKPNIVYIIADDLGYAEVGCYGQKKIKTPNIDKLASQGMKFTQHYSGNPVCAPSRCVLMTGKHSGHSQVRGNKQVGGNEGWKLGATTGGQWPLKAGTITVAKILKDAGYRTGAFGKWGLGRVGTTGDPNKQGFDHFFGYICQRQAHTYYPNHLWRDGKVQWLEGNKDGKEQDYSHDLIANEALKFIKTYRGKPFFLYVPFTIPHVALQVPEDSLAEYKGKWPDPPYTGDKGYFPHQNPRACYAAMVTRMDRDVGRIMSLLKDLNLEDNTIVMFTSDNGPTFNGGSDSAFFESARPLRGLKGSVYEGGIRVPFIVRWPGKIKAASTSEHICAFWDFLPTCCDTLGVDAPGDIDGISILPTLLGKPGKQKKHKYLYWELRGRQGVRMGKWKAVRTNPNQKIQLYDLNKDIGEQNDVADANPKITAKMAELMITARTKSDVFPLPRPKS